MVSARIASGTRSRSACPSAGRHGECSASRRSFFKSRHGLLVLGRMARTRADVREAELLEDLADRALVVSDAEALGHDLLQVHPAPAHDSMHGALRAGFNDLGELRPAAPPRGAAGGPSTSCP